MKKRSTGADGAKLRQVVVEQPKMVKKEVEILGKEKQRSNKSSILEASKDDGVRRRGGSSMTGQSNRSMTGSNMMEEIDNILREEGGSSVGDEEEEVEVEAKIEFGGKEWWGCCCKDLNRLVL